MFRLSVCLNSEVGFSVSLLRTSYFMSFRGCQTSRHVIEYSFTLGDQRNTEEALPITTISSWHLRQDPFNVLASSPSCFLPKPYKILSLTIAFTKKELQNPAIWKYITVPVVGKKQQINTELQYTTTTTTKINSSRTI